MDEQLRFLRTEFNRASFKSELRKQKGCKCVNCGSEELVEYHHIVPLMRGGTNQLSNIVPLCAGCHVASHGGVYGGDKKKGGRPRRTFNKEQQVYLWLYFHNQIGKKAVMKGINTTDTKLSCQAWYDEMKRKCKAPEDFYNNIDLIASQPRKVESLRRTRERCRTQVR